jgi:hypothetical protein
VAKALDFGIAGSTATGSTVTAQLTAATRPARPGPVACSNEWYAQHLSTVHESKQEIMLGYSDSGGYALPGVLGLGFGAVCLWGCVSAGLYSGAPRGGSCGFAGPLKCSPCRRPCPFRPQSSLPQQQLIAPCCRAVPAGKDAGRLAAAWALYKAQEELVAVCKERGIQLTLFHGRGGTGECGYVLPCVLHCVLPCAPALRACLALEPCLVHPAL